MKGQSCESQFSQENVIFKFLGQIRYSNERVLFEIQPKRQNGTHSYPMLFHIKLDQNHNSPGSIVWLNFKRDPFSPFVIFVIKPS